jgi:cytochrome c
MTIRHKIVYFNILTALFLYVFISISNMFSNTNQQENTPPTVKIINPKNSSAFDFNTAINYEISVADKEDGNSKYDEINAKEVLLEVRHVDRLPATNKAAQPDAPGIAIMRTSNCFNCHNFNVKGIGPSFFEISKKYPANKSNVDTLVKHIREGSTGTWGKEKMPTHTEMTSEEIKTTVQWILKKATDPEVDYYIGLNGSFRIKPAVNTKSKGVYVLTATYLDHGSKASPGKQRLKGQDAVVITGR